MIILFTNTSSGFKNSRNTCVSHPAVVLTMLFHKTSKQDTNIQRYFNKCTYYLLLRPGQHMYLMVAPGPLISHSELGRESPQVYVFKTKQNFSSFLNQIVNHYYVATFCFGRS